MSAVTGAVAPPHTLVPLVFELVTYVFFALMVLHIWKYARELKNQDGDWRLGDENNRARWLSTLLWGVFFGYIAECVLSAFNAYDYPKQTYLIPMLPNLLDTTKPVPLWVSTGWGILLYATSWTAQRLKQSRFARPTLAALLAINVDLSLDPLARFFGMWKGPGAPPHFYTVPFDNFVGWFLIIFMFTLVTRWLFEKLGNLPGSAIWVPGIGAVAALVLVYAVDQWLPDHVYAHLPGGDMTFFFVLSAVAMVYVVRKSQRLQCDLTPSWAILAVPVTYHLLCFLVLAFLGDCLGSEHPERPTLLVLIGLALTSGFVAFAWSSIDKLFPRAPGASGGSSTPPTTPALP